MSRLARAVAAGFAHHITQRGSNRRDVFFVDDDRRVYLKLLKEQADKYSLELTGYWLAAVSIAWIFCGEIPRGILSLLGEITSPVGNICRSCATFS